MPCEEKERLVSEYTRAAIIYSRGLRALKREKGPSAEHDRLRQDANTARVNCKEAHLALESHKAIHDRGSATIPRGAPSRASRGGKASTT